jgi:hypothetical protein
MPIFRIIRVAEIAGRSLRVMVLSIVVIMLFLPLSINHTPALGQDTEVAPRAGDKGGIVIVSISTRYDAQMGSFHLFGEVQNQLKGSSAAGIMLNATFYENTRNIIGSLAGSPYISFLNTGEKSAFELVSYGDDAVMLANFSHYTISATWDETQRTMPGFLKLRVDNIFLDPCGSYNITGTVTNYGRILTDNIVISAAFYNERGQIQASAYTKLANNQKNLAPAVSAPFTFIIEKSILSHFAHYSINVHSTDYSEFSGREIDERNPPSIDEIFQSIANQSNTVQLMGMPTITVSSDSTVYGIGMNKIKILGTVAPSSIDSKVSQGSSSIVVMRILTTNSGSLEVATTPLPTNGSFSRVLEFLAPEGSQGMVFRITASYRGAIAENTFAIAHGGSLDGSLPLIDYSEICANMSVIDAKYLGWTSNSGTDSNDENSIPYSKVLNDKIKVGEDLILSTIAENKVSRPQPIVTVIEVDDSSGAGVFLYFDKFMLDSTPGATYQTNVPWSPNATGVYTLKTFLISGLEQPRIISPIIMKKLFVL